MFEPCPHKKKRSYFNLLCVLIATAGRVAKRTHTHKHTQNQSLTSSCLSGKKKWPGMGLRGVTLFVRATEGTHPKADSQLAGAIPSSASFCSHGIEETSANEKRVSATANRRVGLSLLLSFFFSFAGVFYTWRAALEVKSVGLLQRIHRPVAALLAIRGGRRPDSPTLSNR